MVESLPRTCEALGFIPILVHDAGLGGHCFVFCVLDTLLALFFHTGFEQGLERRDQLVQWSDLAPTRQSSGACNRNLPGGVLCLTCYKTLTWGWVGAGKESIKKPEWISFLKIVKLVYRVKGLTVAVLYVCLIDLCSDLAISPLPMSMSPEHS